MFVLLLVANRKIEAQHTVALPAEDRLLSGEPTDVFSVGRAVGEPWEMFSRVRELAFDGDGNLYVLDRGNHRVVVFDRSGAFVREFGRRGQGPGEFQNPFSLTTTSSGDVVVNDIGNRALVFLSPSGAYLKQVSLADIIDRPGRVRAAADGRILSISAGRETPEGRFARLYVLPTRTGETGLELGRMPLAPMLQMRLRSSEGISRLRRTPVYAPEPYFAVTSDGAAVLQTEVGYGLRVFDRQGRHVRTLTRALPEIPVTEELRNAFLRDWARVRVENGAPADLPYDPPFADVMSQVTGLEADRAGRVWVRRRAENGDDGGPIDLITAAGEYIGTIRGLPLPSAFGPDGMMAYIVADEMGVERVMVRRQPAIWH